MTTMHETAGSEGSDDLFDEFNRAMGADGDASPYPGFAEVRARTPIDGGSIVFDQWEDAAADTTIHLFTTYSYEATQAVLGDGDTFSSAGYAEVMGAVFGHSILEMDEPEHHRYRALISQAFSRKAMERWETELVAPVVERYLDRIAPDGATGGRADLVKQLFFPFPVEVIAAMMGIPAADLAMFHRLAIEMIGVTIDWDRAVRASGDLRDYFSTLIAERRAGDGADLISVLARATQDGQRLSDDEIYAFLRLMMPAGAETTYRSSSNLMFGLLSNPDQLDAVRADRSLVPQAIEEGIRWEAPLLIIARSATRDTEVCGVAVPEGSTVIVGLGAANHDPARWPDPERFDIFREKRPHIGFAHGPHLCLGMHLARMETTVALNALFDRLPGLRFDPDAAPAYITGMTFRAPPRLDVCWA